MERGKGEQKMTEAIIVTIGAVVLTIVALIVGFVIGYDTAYEEMDGKRGRRGR